MAWEEVEEDATEPDATMPNHEPATENTGINLAELSEKCDADPELKIALENLNVIFVVLKRSAELDPEEKLKILLNIKIPCNNITLFGSDMERTDKKTVAEFIIDHFGITDIDALTAKVMEIDQQCKKDEGAYALLTDLLKKDTATDDGPQTDEQPSPQPANDEPNTQWLEESDPFDELAEMTGDEPILPPAPKPAPKPESEPNIEDDPFSEDNIVGGD